MQQDWRHLRPILKLKKMNLDHHIANAGAFASLIKSTLSCVLRKFRDRFLKWFAVKTVVAPRNVV